MHGELLQELGFSRNEARIYLALLELGPSPLGMLCGKAKIHRRNVYDCLEMLKEKGFVSSMPVNGRNIFEAANPQRLIDMLETKKEKILQALPRFPSKKTRSKIRVYTGQAGRKLMFEEKLKVRGMQFVLGAHLPSPQSRRFVDLYHYRRARKKIPLKMLFSESEKEAARIFGKYPLVQARILPQHQRAPIAINLYGTITALLLGSSTLEPLTIIIEDSGLVRQMKSYFMMLWALSKPLK